MVVRADGAEVTGVCGTTGVDLVRSLGAVDVINGARQGGHHRMTESFGDTATRIRCLLDGLPGAP